MSERIIVLTEQDVKEAPSKVIDLLANLARRVTELEKRVRIIDEHNDVLIDRINDVEAKPKNITINIALNKTDDIILVHEAIEQALNAVRGDE